ncbi:hypothetical protein, partial [Bacillus cereus]|uniref:hypothetical protein n=1 Tax=Bacillus cereus TaxID=1396 RepID=UPI00285295F4
MNNKVRQVSKNILAPILIFISLHKKNSAKLQRNAKLASINPTVKFKFPMMKMTNRERSKDKVNVK